MNSASGVAGSYFFVTKSQSQSHFSLSHFPPTRGHLKINQIALSMYQLLHQKINQMCSLPSSGGHSKTAGCSHQTCTHWQKNSLPMKPITPELLHNYIFLKKTSR